MTFTSQTKHNCQKLLRDITFYVHSAGRHTFTFESFSLQRYQWISAARQSTSVVVRLSSREQLFLAIWLQLTVGLQHCRPNTITQWIEIR